MKTTVTMMAALLGFMGVAKTVVQVPTIPTKTYTGEYQRADVPESELYETTYNEQQKAAGEYEVELQLTDPANYTWPDTDDDWIVVPFRIRQARNGWTTPPSIEGWTYGETANAPVAVPQFGNVKVRYDGTAKDGTVLSDATSVTKAGDYEAVFTVAGNANYTGLTNRVPFTVAQAPVSGGGSGGGAISVNVGNYEGMYDGQGHSITVEVTGDDASTFSITYALNGAGPFSAAKPMFTDVCSETVWYVLSSPNYAAVTNSAIVTIAKRTVTLTSGSANKVYDGVPVRNGDVHIAGDGFVSGEGATYNVTGSQTDVGMSENSFTYTLDDGTKAGNYEISTVSGTLTVTAADVSIWTDETKWSVTLSGDGAEYDGTEKTCDVTALSYDGFSIPMFTVSGNTATNAGNYTLMVTAAGNFAGTRAVPWSIVKGTYDMSGAKWDYAGAFEYDRTEKTVCVTGLPDGVTASYTGNTATLPGSYTAQVSLAYDEANYNEPAAIEDLVWCIGSSEENALTGAFDGLPVVIGPDGAGGWLVTLTNDIHLMDGPIEIPDNLVHVTVNMNGFLLEGGDGENGDSGFPAIKIVPAAGDGEPTRLSFMTTGGASEVQGGVEASAVVVDAEARAGVLVDVGAGVTVRSGGRCPAVVGKVGTLGAMESLPFTVIPPLPRSYEIETEAVLEQSGVKGTAATNPKNGLVRVGETATLTAKASNKNTAFAYWLDGEGNIASYTASWKTTPEEDVFYQAVFRLKKMCVRPVFDPANEYGADGRPSVNSMVGVAFNAQVSVNREAYPVKFSAKGLPKGLKINATTGVISGVPTKAGTFAATITVKSAVNAKLKASSKKLMIGIAALPAWARGNFGGAVYATNGTDNGQVTMSVGATGKISGKIAAGGTNWTFAASSWSVASDATNGLFAAAGTASRKVGKTTYKQPWTVTLSARPSGALYQGATVVEGVLGDMAFEAQRNFWKDKDAAGMLSDWVGAYTWLTPNGEALTLTLDAKGSVKVVGTVDGGRKLSVATTAFYDTAHAGSSPYLVYIYAAPTMVTTKNKKGKVVSKVSYPAFIATVALDNAPGVPVAGGDVAYRKQGVRPAVDGASTGTGSFKYSTAYGQAASNATVTVTAVPAKGNVFAYWAMGDEIVGYGVSYKVQMGDGDFTGLTAVFHKATTAVDPWAKGTYKGNGLLAGKKAAVTLTVGATGKVSGKFTVAKKAYSFAGTVYVQEGTYRTTGSVKYGSKAYPLVIAVGQDGETGKAFVELAVIDGENIVTTELAK